MSIDSNENPQNEISTQILVLSALAMAAAWPVLATDGDNLIGIGVANTARETNTFRRRHHVPFPVFADPAKITAGELGVAKRPS